MLNKYMIVLAAFLFGTAATTIVASVRAKNFRRIASHEETRAELRGFDRGWSSATDSAWLRIHHYNQHLKDLKAAENEI